MGNFKVLTSTEFNSKEKCRIISSKIAFSTSYNFIFGGVVQYIYLCEQLRVAQIRKANYMFCGNQNAC